MLGHSAISEASISELPSSGDGVLVSRRKMGGNSRPPTTCASISRRFSHRPPAILSTERYTASQEWVCPADVHQIVVECVGGGGGGARINFSVAGGGGGGGAYARKTVVVTPGNSYTLTVGAGGAGGAATAPGSDGGDTSFESDVVAKGGVGADAGPDGNGGAGGSASASTGTVKFDGGAGGNGNGIPGGGGGGGGAGTSSANGANGGNGTSLAVGATVSGLGAGGQGGSSGIPANQNGANGSGGQVLITFETAGIAPQKWRRSSRQRQLQGSVPQQTLGSLTRKFGHADAPANVKADVYRRAVKQPLFPHALLDGGTIARSGQQPNAPAGLFIERLTIRPSVGQSPIHPVGQTQRRFGHPDAVGFYIELRRVAKQAHYPSRLLDGGNISRRKQRPDAPPPPSTKRVPNLVRNLTPILPRPFAGRIVRRPDIVRYTPPGPTELLFTVRRHPAMPPHPSILDGTIKRRDGFAPNESIPRRVNFARNLRQKRPTQDAFEGRIKRRDGLSQDIIPPPFTPLKRFRRRLPSKRPPPHAFEGLIARRFGVTAPTWVEYAETYEQGFRAADDSLECYELYVGEDQAPDFASPPQATSATLPFSWTPTPPASGTKTLHIVVRKRNKYDLQSFNVKEALQIIDAAGASVAPAVSAPSELALYDDVTGYFRVHAKYDSSDDVLPADQWDIYVKVGSAPVLGVDLVTYTTGMRFLGTESTIVKKLGPYTPGDTLYVLVVSRRDSDNELASASALTLVLATPPTLDEGLLFGGSAYEQR